MALSAALLTALVGRGQPSITAEDALRRSLERRSSVNVDAVVEQMSPWGSGYIRVRLSRDAAGRRRTEVLSPIAMRGQVSVDDGTVWTTYFPDERRVRSHPSPMLVADDIDLRMRLVKRNYRLEIDDKATIAGRSALRVVAHPRTSEMETRRYYLDASTFVPLKIETVNELGGVSVQLAVRHIEYPKGFEGDTFEPFREKGNVVKASPPKTVKDLADAEHRVGFRPAAPRRLPMGFRPQGMEVVDWHGVTPIQTRLTDGLVRLFIYQFRPPADRPERPPRPGEDERTVRKVGDLRVLVRGDAPIAVRERILAIYAKALEAGH